MDNAWVLRIGMALWLAALSWSDVRAGRIPHWGTTAVLVGLAGLAALHGVLRLSGLVESGAVLDDLLIVVAFLALLVSDDVLYFILFMALCLSLVPLSGGAAALIACTWIGGLVLAKLGFIGSGDAKVLMVATAFIPDLRLAALMLLAAGGIGLLALIRRVGLATPLLIGMTLKDLLAGRFPARTGERGTVLVPITLAMAPGALAYVWLIWRGRPWLWF